MLLLRHFVEQLVSVLLLPLGLEDEAVATAAAPAG
jgi:hypothetical protein